MMWSSSQIKYFVLSVQWLKTQRYSLYDKIWFWKAAHGPIWEEGTHNNQLSQNNCRFFFSQSKIVHYYSLSSEWKDAIQQKVFFKHDSHLGLKTTDCSLHDIPDSLWSSVWWLQAVKYNQRRSAKNCSSLSSHLTLATKHVNLHKPPSEIVFVDFFFF